MHCPATINRFAYVTVYPQDDLKVRIRSLNLGYTVKYNIEVEIR
jgi:hypothetical protein